MLHTSAAWCFSEHKVVHEEPIINVTDFTLSCPHLTQTKRKDNTNQTFGCCFICPCDTRIPCRNVLKPYGYGMEFLWITHGIFGGEWEWFFFTFTQCLQQISESGQQCLMRLMSVEILQSFITKCWDRDQMNCLAQSQNIIDSSDGNPVEKRPGIEQWITSNVVYRYWREHASVSRYLTIID